MEYHAADRVAVEGRLQDAEATANELIASVHNQRGEYVLALYHAQHAAAVARMADDQALVARAEEERALALKGSREIAGAVAAYADASGAIGTTRPGGSYFVSLITDALHLCTTERRNDLKMDLLRRVFPAGPEGPGQKGSPLQVLLRVLPAMADQIERVDHVLTIVALATADTLADVPSVVQRRIVREATDTLFPLGGEEAG